MTLKPTIQAKKNPAAQVLGWPGGKEQASVLSDAELSKTGKKGAKARMEIPTPDERYEIARKAAEDRIARQRLLELRNKP
jgi:hypothetical protein